MEITRTDKNRELQNLETIEKKAQRVDRLADLCQRESSTPYLKNSRSEPDPQIANALKAQ